MLLIVELMSTQLNSLDAASNSPTQSAFDGTSTTMFEVTATAPANFSLNVMLVLGQLNVLVEASKTPTQSALDGANTTFPFEAVAAPINL